MSTGRTKGQSQFGFVLGRSVLAHHTATKAVFTCRCGAINEVTPTYPLNPPFIAKIASKDGWQVDAWRKSVTRCPKCLAAKSPGESPKEITMVAATPLNHPTKPAAVPPSTTPAQRQKIRALLDANFDDAAGCYLGGYSDQRIGKELDLPWACVTALRETAYGPIRQDPEVAALRADLREIEAAAAQLAKLITATNGKINALEKARAA